MKKIMLFAVVAFLAVGLSTSEAQAYSWADVIGGYVGPVKFKFSDLSVGSLYTEDSDGYGNADDVSDAFGIFKVTSVLADVGLGTTLWSDGDGGAELTGVFRDIDDDFWTFENGIVNIQSVGGYIDVYFDTTPDADGGTGPGDYSGITDGDLYLSLAMVPGIAFGDGDPDNDHITYDNNLDLNTNQLTGDGTFYLDILGGDAAGSFVKDYWSLVDDDGATHYADFFAEFDVVVIGLDGNGEPIADVWLTSSEDPIKGATIPEPTSMILMGIGLVGAALRRRRTG